MLDDYLDEIGFSDTFSSKLTQLEVALQGMIFHESLQIDYGDSNVNKSQVYVLPVEYIEGFLNGFFLIGRQLIETPIGFKQTTDFCKSDYFHIEPGGALVKAEALDWVLYLPLKITKNSCTLGKYADNIFLSARDKSKVYGLDGTNPAYPVILYSETEKGILLKGIFKNTKGVPELYNEKFMPSEETFLKQIVSAIRVCPYNREIINTCKNSAQITTKKEPIINKKPNTATSTGCIHSQHKKSGIDWVNPKSIVSFLDQYLIGQSAAKQKIAVAFSNYMAQYNYAKDAHPDEKLLNHILLIGPSGVGKTYAISLLAREANLPIATAKLTGKSASGYKGQNLSTVFKQIRAQAEEESPYGIVFLDEIDKLVAGQSGVSSSFGPDLQNELIGWLEEELIEFENVKEQNKSIINTKNLLFVTSGAFRGFEASGSLESVISKRIDKSDTKIGFTQSLESGKKASTSLLAKVQPEDLIAYGLKNELVGRLPNIVIFDSLTTKDKIRILTYSRGSVLKKYETLFGLKGYTLKFSETVPRIIAESCPAQTGARALSSICNDIFTGILYEPEKYSNDRIIKLTPRMAQKIIEYKSMQSSR